MYGWVPCTSRWPGYSTSRWISSTCQRLQTRTLKLYCTYHRDRFQVRITQDDEFQLLDNFDQNQMVVLNEHYQIIPANKLNKADSRLKKNRYTIHAEIEKSIIPFCLSLLSRSQSPHNHHFYLTLSNNLLPTLHMLTIDNKMKLLKFVGLSSALLECHKERGRQCWSMEYSHVSIAINVATSR